MSIIKNKYSILVTIISGLDAAKFTAAGGNVIIVKWKYRTTPKRRTNRLRPTPHQTNNFV